MPARRRDPVSVPRVLPSSYVSKPVRHDYSIDDSISRMGYISNAVLEDTFDAAAKSRGKDHELLRSANSAIVSTELHSSPRAAVVSRRVRATSVPPVSGQRRVVAASPSYSKAAIIGSKMEAEDAGKKKKRPRSAYAAAKYRETRKEPSEDAIYYTAANHGALHASRPPLPKPTERKAIRDVDGFTKPRNVMSWQYRVESRLNPDDLIYQPATFSRMRDRVREAQEKMDRHRQLLDRYLDKDTVSASTSRKDTTSGGSSSVKIPAYYARSYQ